MKGYAICFILTSLLTIFANKFKNNKHLYILFAICASLVLSFFCGYRDYTIVAPRDYKMYVAPLVQQYSEMNFFTFAKTFNGLEIGFVTLSYIILKIFNDAHTLLFVFQFICSILVFRFAYLRKNESPILIIIIYMLFWYMLSYTLIRQSIALCLTLLGLEYMSEEKTKKGIILMIIAIMFHSTAIIVAVMYIYMRWYMKKSNSSNNKNFIMICSLILICVVAFFYKQIIYTMIFSLHILPTKMYSYISDSRFYLEEGSLKKIELSLTILATIIGTIYTKIKKEEKIAHVYLFYLIIGLILLLMSTKVSLLNRLSYYFLIMPFYYFYTNINRIFKKETTNQIVATSIVVIVFLTVWIYKYPMIQEWETFPYISDIFTFLN